MASALFQQLVGWSGILLLLVLAGRAVQRRLCALYPAFYAYIGYVLLISVGALLVAWKVPRLYPDFYWVTEFLSMLLGLGVTLEVFRKAFAGFPGVRKFANLLISLLAVLAISRLSLGGLSTRELTTILLELERDLRFVQALMLAAFAALVLYYAIPIGRNLMGIALGYGLFVSTSVFNLTLRTSLGSGFQTAWSYLQPLEYCVCLTIWCFSLWSLAAGPLTEAPADGSRAGYDSVSRETELLLGRLRSRMLPERYS